MSPEDQLPQTKDDLLQRIDASWRKVLDAVASRKQDEMLVPHEGSWTAKDHLAHLAFWERYLVRHHFAGEPVDQVAGLPPGTTQDLDTDDVNNLVYLANRERSLPEVQHELLQSHAAMLDALQALPWDTLMQQHYPDDPEKRPLLLWVIGNTYDHYEEHLPALMERLL